MVVFLGGGLNLPPRRPRKVPAEARRCNGMKREKCQDNPDHPMKLASIWDDTEKGIAYNVWHCLYCGSIAIEHVWKNARVVG